QAEDGIRDKLVTGVQTCALPILDCAYPDNQAWGAIFITAGMVTASNRKTYDYSSYNFLMLDLKGAKGGEAVAVGVKTESDLDNRSEERRVGKESRNKR